MRALTFMCSLRDGNSSMGGRSVIHRRSPGPGVPEPLVQPHLGPAGGSGPQFPPQERETVSSAQRGSESPARYCALLSFIQCTNLQGAPPGARLCASASELKTPQGPNDKAAGVQRQLQDICRDPQT